MVPDFQYLGRPAAGLFGFLHQLSTGDFQDVSDRESLINAAIVKAEEVINNLRLQRSDAEADDPHIQQQRYAKRSKDRDRQ